MFRSTENFPGSVPNPTDPTAIFEVQIDATLNEEFGYVGGYSTNAARRMTVACLAPGTIVEAGQYKLVDGTTVVAGNRTGQDHNVQTYSLGSASAGLDVPLVFANVVTDVDPSAVTTRLHAVSNNSFILQLQEEEAADGIHGAETISFFAV